MQDPQNDIVIVGDVFLKTRSGTSPPFCKEIENYFQKMPCVLLNLETVLTEDRQSKEKAVSIKSEPSIAAYLKEAGVDVVNLANNHTFDYGIEGFHSTIAALEAEGIGYTGVLKQGNQDPYINRIGMRSVGISSYTMGGTQGDTIGVAPLEKQEIIADIENLKRRNIDQVIINLHWGEEYAAYPSPEQQRLARCLIDCGADVVIGHHPHVVQGIESYKEGIIFYSLGNFNFISPNKMDQHFRSSRWGLIAVLNLSDLSSIKYKFIPVQIDAEYRPSFVDKEESERLLTYLHDISAPLKPRIKKSFWFKECSLIHFQNHLPSFFYRIKNYGIRHLILMLRWMISPRNFGFYMGLILLFFSKLSQLTSSEASCQPKGK